MTDHSERSHAILGPSFMKVALNCSGAVVLKQKFPILTQSTYAAEGTRFHEICEIVLGDFLEHKISGADPDIRAALLQDNKVMLDYAYQYRDIVWQQVLQESITGKAYAIEDRLVTDDRLELWGTTDFWAIGPDDRARVYGVVGDIKYGFRYVEEKNNPQLAAYAVALRDEVRRAGKDLDYVHAFIFQPRANGEAYRTTKFTSKQLDTWRKKFIACGENIFVHKKIKFKVGDWCKDCHQNINCELYGKTLSKETQIQFLDAKSIQFPDVNELSDEVLINLMLREDAIKQYLSNARKRTMTKLFNGVKLELPNGSGVKLVEGTAKRKWDSARTAELIALLDQYGIDARDIGVRGITQVQAELGNLLGEKQAKDIIDGYCLRGDPPVSLVPISDPRPAKQGAVQLLTQIEESDE